MTDSYAAQRQATLDGIVLHRLLREVINKSNPQALDDIWDIIEDSPAKEIGALLSMSNVIMELLSFIQMRVDPENHDEAGLDALLNKMSEALILGGE